jgi:hypothetical protein
VQVIKCDFKPGSVERSIELDQEDAPSAGLYYFQMPQPIKIENFHDGIPLYPILIAIKTF